MTHCLPQAIPQVLLLEVCQKCNAACIFCPRRKLQVHPDIMSWDIFEAAVNQFAARGGQIVSLTPNLGDPLLDPLLLDRLHWCRDKNFKVIHMYTNGIALNRYRPDQIIDSGLTRLSFSMAPPDPELYTQIMGVRSCERAYSNIAKLLRIYASCHDPILKNINIEFRAPMTIDHIEMMPGYKQWIAPFLHDNVHVMVCREYDAWDGLISPEDLPEGMTIRRHQHTNTEPCYNLSYLRVDCDGNMRLCGCRINPQKADDLSVGNLNDTSIDAAFASHETTKLFERAEKGIQPDSCKNCAWHTCHPGSNLKSNP